MPDTSQTLMKHIYHKTLGKSPAMYAIDANSAVQLHPTEWSYDPWPGSDDAKEYVIPPKDVVIYHKILGAQKASSQDAAAVVSGNPAEWSNTPWPGTVEAKKIEDAARAARTAKAAKYASTPAGKKAAKEQEAARVAQANKDRADRISAGLAPALTAKEQAAFDKSEKARLDEQHRASKQ